MKKNKFFRLLCTLIVSVVMLLAIPFTTIAQGVASGTVVAWGSNYYGETSPPAGLTDAVAIASRYDGGLALKADGTVVSWGRNRFGETDVPAGLTDVVAIGAGGYHNLAVKEDGTIAGWGWNYYGQASSPVGLTDVVAVAGGYYHSLALKADGTVVGWGLNYGGAATPPSGLNDVVAIACGTYHSLALKADGTVVAWGSNSEGQTNIPVGLTDVVAIAGGWGHSLAVTADGTVVGWGWPDFGVANPPAGLTNVVAVATAQTHSLALKADGTVVAFGSGWAGQLDVPEGLTDVVAIGAGLNHSFALVIPNEPPVASANGPYVVAVGQSITLDHTGSYDPDGDDLTYIWEVTGEGDPLGTIAGEIFSAGDQAGINEVTLIVDDGREGIATSKSMVVVYDPSGGFVTGGGWFTSPPNAYQPDPTLEGKAAFGFVSKYKKDAEVPEGNTEFQFKAGDLNFHSDRYKWLVVTGSNYAKFLGQGTINGEGINGDLYKFQIWAGDNDPDTFRIKIWWEEMDGNEHVVYDNGMDQAIGGGGIVIHKAK